MARLGETMLDSFILGSDIAIGGTFVAVFWKLHSSRSAAGLSLQTLVAMVSARVLHMLSHFMGLHYSPVVLPKALFGLFDVVNACAGLYSLFVFINYFYETYDKEKDNFGIQLFDKLNCMPRTGPFKNRSILAASFLYVAVAIAALAWYAVRPRTSSFATGYYCCFYEAMSAIALMPQLWMFNKDKRVQPLLAMFVVLVAVGRILTLSFWWSYPYVYPYRIPGNRSFQMTSEVLNLLILSDFLYYWARSKVLGQKDVILGGLEVLV